MTHTQTSLAALLLSGILAAGTTAAGDKPVYPDGRPAATLRLEATDQGVVLKHGDGPGQCDVLGARDVWVYEAGGTYYMHYDGAGPKGWLASLATSTDLVHWTKKGPVLDFGKPGEDDSASASYGVTYLDGSTWHMFYLGTPHTSPAPDLIPSFPYLTMKAKGASPAGPWTKQGEVVPFRTKPGTYYSATASPGHIIRTGDDYRMFFSASTDRPIKRTLGIARTKNLDGPWTIDAQPIVPLEEQVENSSLYFEPANQTWFLFTNHIGLEGFEYTDAVWVYWTKDLDRWNTADKAVVLDGRNCRWSRKCIGLPSVVKVGDRLAVLYDAPGGDSKSHMKRDVGLAWLSLPLTPPVAKTVTNEAQVPPYTLPDPLVCQDGTRVTDAQTWRDRRRPELLRLFESEEYGRTLLGRSEAMRFVVREEKKDARGGKATRLRVGVLFEGKEDGRQMEMLVYLPNHVQGPVPVFFGFNFDGNYTTTDEPDIPLAKHFAMGLYANKLVKNTPTEAGRGIHQAMWPYDLALERGYGVATAAYGEVEPDADGRWKEGPRGLGPEPGTKDWGSIGAWAWAYSRALDYLETNPRVDARRVALIGFSRIGKAALWAGAQDERFALVISNNSGGGGVALSKRIFGETVANLTGGPLRWFCPSFRQYANNETALPMDQHELAALIAPRPLLIVSATEDLWSDPKGEFLSGLGADPVYRLLGTDGLSCKEWPAPGQLVDSRIGYFLRAGKHDVTREDWEAMLKYADRQLRK